jgi:hypothetical protein
MGFQSGRLQKPGIDDHSFKEKQDGGSLTVASEYSGPMCGNNSLSNSVKLAEIAVPEQT